MIDRCHRPAGERDRPTLAAHSPGAVTASCTFLWYFSGRFPAVAKPMSAMEKPVYRFGEFELDPDERRLLAHGEPVALTPKVFDTLVLLVERAGHAVSKDELMHALWPRGFVDESNLTKHVWLIRKALGDSEHDARCIETVPKRGYRFVAPVQRMARENPVAPDAIAAPIAAAGEDAVSARAGTAALSEGAAIAASAVDMRIDRNATADTERSPQSTVPQPAAAALPRKRRTWIGAAAAAIVVATGLSVWRFASHETPAPAANPPGSAIAIVAFNNLSQNAKDAWLGPALGEMLATEIATGGRMHALPDELVRPAREDLAAPLAGGYAAQSLATLRRRLGTDYVLSGSYLVSGSGDQPLLRLDLALQDARSGATITNLAHTGAVADLPALIVQAGAALREQLGMRSASSSELLEVAAAQPPTAEVARRIGFALDALHRDDPARARDELLDAVAQAPGYAPAYSYLAQAWSALGYKAKALAAAEQAAAHAQGLPEEQRLQIDAQVQKAQHDWSKAIETARALVKLRPRNPEYRFQLVSTLLAAGKPDAAQDALTMLMKLPGPIGNDPRVELEQAWVAREDKQVAAHAERALQQARQREETGLAAEAGTLLGVARWHLGDLGGAEAALKQARADYTRIGNPHGEAWADQNLGNTYSGSNPAGAREAYQRALAGYQAIGDRNGEAAIYSDLGIMLWSAGDHDGTETALRKSLAIRRDTADLAGQAWNLTGLATVELDTAASDEAANDYREAITLDEQAGERSHRAFALTQYSDLQRLRGDLAAAAATCAQALAGYREIGNTDGTATADFQCSQIALDRGDVDAARAGAERARVAATSFKDSMLSGNADLLSAQIAIGQRDWRSAIAYLQSAIRTCAAAELTSGEAVAQSLLAISGARVGRDVERDRAAARARELRSRITEHQEVFAVDITLAQLRGASGQADGAIAALRGLVAEADKRNWLAWSLESRLALLQLLERRRDLSAARTRDQLAKDASAHGFGWILARMRGDPRS